MKTLSCDRCEERISAESFDDWFGKMKEHYASKHADAMAASANKTKEEGMEWMLNMRAKFDAL